MDQEKVIVIDFGGQYNQLVARRVRECNVFVKTMYIVRFIHIRQTLSRLRQ
mgnify:CR=1 FL=1